MDIDRNYNQTLTAYRLNDDESGYGQQYNLLEADIPAHIQPLDDRYTEDIEGNFGKDFIMLCALRDLKEGDKLTDGTVSYRIVGLERLDRGHNKHMEIIIRTFNQ